MGPSTRMSRARARAPRASFEEIEIHTEDGIALRAAVDEPEGKLRGTCVLAHAMFARKSTFAKGLSAALVAKGFRTIAFDFRGHGDSTKVEGWTYDDLVRVDLPAVVGCARARAEDAPVVVVGHSLGGHVAAASQGAGHLDADAIVGVGANVWLRELEPSRTRWLAKIAVARATLAVAARAGKLPVRRMRIGSDDASLPYLRDLFRGVTEGTWRSADGRDDYLASLAKIRVPFANVLGDRDRINCHPACGERLARRCSGRVEIFRAPVDHMGLVTDSRAHPAVVRAVEWAVAQTRP